MPGKYIEQSALQKRPAVRFETTTGFASSPDRPVDIKGDVALTITLVINLQPHEVEPPYGGVFGIGNPANPSADPGKPLAALVQINRGEDHALHFAGGWNHDASLGAGSFKPYYGKDDHPDGGEAARSHADSNAAVHQWRSGFSRLG